MNARLDWIFLLDEYVEEKVVAINCSLLGCGSVLAGDILLMVSAVLTASIFRAVYEE
jgi:hypothetical protein